MRTEEIQTFSRNAFHRFGQSPCLIETLFPFRPIIWPFRTVCMLDQSNHKYLLDRIKPCLLQQSTLYLRIKIIFILFYFIYLYFLYKIYFGIFERINMINYYTLWSLLFYTAIMTINVFWQLNVLAHSTRYKIFSRWHFEVYIYFLKTDFGISYKLPAYGLTISECLNQEKYLFILFTLLLYFILFLFIYFFFFIFFLFIYYYYARGYLV